MVDILVRPPELRQIAEDLSSHAKKLQDALDTVDNEIRALGGSTFVGMRADALRAHYSKILEKIYQIKPLINHFASDLNEAASRFEAADKGQPLPKTKE